MEVGGEKVMLDFKKILIGFDGSTCSRKALKVSESLAKLNEIELIVVYVHEPGSRSNQQRLLFKGLSPHVRSSQIHNVTPFSGMANLTFEEESPQSTEVVDEYHPLEEAQSLLDERIKADYVMLTGDPATEISKFSTENNIDLIIVGKSSSSKIEKVFMGNVSKHVVDKLPSSVLVVK